MKDRFGIDWSGITGTFFWKQPQLSRRLFFRHAGSAVGGYFLLPSRPMEATAQAAGAAIGKAKNVIFVMMAGGPSHVDTFDLKEGSWTPGFLEPTSYGDVRWPRGLMPKLAEHMGDIALVRSVRSWAAVHEFASVWVQIGRNPISGLAKIAPHIGSVVSIESSRTEAQMLPAFVSLNANNGPGAGYLPSENSPFYLSPAGGGLGNAVHGPGQQAFQRRASFLQQIDAEARASAPDPAFSEMASFHLGARKLMYNAEISRIFTFDAAQRAEYGTTGFGNACITARNILRANAGTRFIQITLGGWDQHQNIYQPAANGLQNLSRTFDNGLGKLISDLKTDGLFESTLIVAMGEFGRTVGMPNNQGGRDHFLQQAALVTGAGVRGGRAIGATDEEGRGVSDAGWSRNREIRAEDISATIYSALGIDWTTVRRDDPTGRGFEYVPFSDRDLYGPVHELWS
ncbi:MAG TPA: DUF1501 domain-containing protein [Bryobacteraceae bacterium]|nr:DUF1501 domain-containing protein [Bryobacteraceae bacterium]